MKAAEKSESCFRPHAGAVLLWCVIAGVAVSCVLVLPPPKTRGFAFWNANGAPGVLASCALFMLVFLLPSFLRKHGTRALAALAAVLFTACMGLWMLNALAGLPAGAFAGMMALVVIVGAGAACWASVLEDRPGLYYGAWALMAFGAPVVRFFAAEFLGVDAFWMGALSPFSAAWHMVDARAADLPALGVFGVVLVVGTLAAFLRKRRAGA
jgi:hypothetical protein